MKTYLFLVISCFFSVDGLAQADADGIPEPLIGKEFNTARKSNFSGFIGVNENTIFAIDYLALNRKKQELKLRRIQESTLELVDSKELFSVIKDGFYNEPNEIFYQDNTIFLFSTLSGLKVKYNLVYLEMFNSYGEKISERIVDTLGLDEKYYLTESFEKKGFLLVTHNRYNSIYEQEIGLLAINELGNTIWQKRIKSPVSLQNLTVEKIVYSTQAPIYILCDYGFERANGGFLEDNTDLLNNKYALWGYDPAKNFLKEFDLRIKKRWINGLGLAYNKANELIISGFMNETRKQTINGVFSLIINPDLTVKSSNYYTYKKALYQKFVEAKRVDRVEELEDIEYRDCIVMEDGSYYLIGEHFYQYTERNYDPRTNITTTIENYNYNSILVAYFDSNGKHLWTDRIPKFQHSVNDYGYYSSFSVMQSANELYFFFNDSDKNNDHLVTEYFNYSSFSINRRAQISYVVVNKNGLKSRGVFVNSKNNYMLRAKQCYQIDNSTFYLYGEEGKSRKVFSLKIK